MTLLKNFFFYFSTLFVLFSPKTEAQNIQLITPNNAIESANEIKGMYGEQINISADEILNFYLNQWDVNPYGAQCIHPEASLIEMDDQSASFEWEHVGDHSYIVNYLRLSDGDIVAQGTSNNFIEFSIPNDLYLVTFQSKCSGGFKSGLSIIIIEKAIMFTTKDCFCRKFETVWDSPFSNTLIPSYSWSPLVPEEEYSCQIQYDDGTSASFQAIVEFNGNTPHKVSANEDCMFNINIYADNTVAYASGQASITRGNFTFTNNTNGNNDIFSFIPQPGVSGSIKLQRCVKNIKRDRSGFNESNSETLSFESLLNPFSASTTIRYNLPEQQYVSIHLFNAYGQAIKIIKGHELKEAGVHQMDLDFNGLPNGMYMCVLKTQHQSIPLKLLKTE